MTTIRCPGKLRNGEECGRLLGRITHGVLHKQNDGDSILTRADGVISINCRRCKQVWTPDGVTNVEDNYHYLKGALRSLVENGTEAISQKAAALLRELTNAGITVAAA